MTPCYNCPDRTATCHGSNDECKRGYHEYNAKYLADKAKRDRIRQAINDAAEIECAASAKMQRNVMHSRSNKTCKYGQR